MTRSLRAGHGSSYPPRTVDRYVSNNSNPLSPPQVSLQRQPRSRSRPTGRQSNKRRKTEARSSSAANSSSTRFEVEYLRKKVDVLLETVGQLNQKVDRLLDRLSDGNPEHRSITQSSTHRARENETSTVSTSEEGLNVLQQPERPQNGGTLSNCPSGHIMNMNRKQLQPSDREKEGKIGGLDDYRQRAYVNRELGTDISRKFTRRINETLFASTNREPGTSVLNNSFHSIEDTTPPVTDVTGHFQDENSLFHVSSLTVKAPNATTSVSRKSRWEGNKDYRHATSHKPYFSDLTRHALNVPVLGMSSPSTLNMAEPPDPVRLDNPTKYSYAETTMASYPWSDDFIPFEG